MGLIIDRRSSSHEFLKGNDGYRGAQPILQRCKKRASVELTRVRLPDLTGSLKPPHRIWHTTSTSAGLPAMPVPRAALSSATGKPLTQKM